MFLVYHCYKSFLCASCESLSALPLYLCIIVFIPSFVPLVYHSSHPFPCVHQEHLLQLKEFIDDGGIITKAHPVADIAVQLLLIFRHHSNTTSRFVSSTRKADITKWEPRAKSVPSHSEKFSLSNVTTERTLDGDI